MQWGEKGAYHSRLRSPLFGNLDMGPGRPALMGPATAGNRPRYVAAQTASMGPLGPARLYGARTPETAAAKPDFVKSVLANLPECGADMRPARNAG